MLQSTQTEEVSSATHLTAVGTKEVAEQSIDLISKIHEIPQFTDKYAERKWAKEHMAGAFRIFAKLGYNDGSGGHISLRDPVNPDHFWISKSLLSAEFWVDQNRAILIRNFSRPVFDALWPYQSQRLDIGFGGRKTAHTNQVQSQHSWVHDPRCPSQSSTGRQRCLPHPFPLWPSMVIIRQAYRDAESR